MSNEDVVVDEKNRTIKLRKLSAIEQSRMVLMVGGDAASNGPYMAAFVFPVCSVREIDGDPVDIPETQRELDALITRLDNEGINAITNHLVESAKANQKKGAGLEQAKN